MSENSSPNTLKTFFSKALLLTPIGVIANLAFILYSKNNLSISTLTQFPAGSLCSIFALSVVPWFTHALRMFMWTRFFNYSIPFSKHVSIAITTELGSFISPTAVGGGCLKAGMLMELGLNPGRAVSLTMLSSLEDYCFYLLFMPIAFFWTQAWNLPVIHQLTTYFSNLLSRSSDPVFVLALVLSLACLYLLTKKHLTRKPQSRITAFLHDINATWLIIRKQGKLCFLATMAITALHWLCKYAVTIILLSTLGVNISPLQIIFMQWLIFIMGLIVPTPGASGAAEASFYLLFQAVIPKDTIGFTTAAWRLLTYYLPLAMGAVTLIFLNRIGCRRTT